MEWGTTTTLPIARVGTMKFENGAAAAALIEEEEVLGETMVLLFSKESGRSS
jgi:hypothetical protein